MGLTFGLYFKAGTDWGICKYDYKVDSQISEYTEQQVYLEKHYCCRCRLNVLGHEAGCWSSSSVDPFLEWAHATSPELEELFRKTQLKEVKNRVLWHCRDIQNKLFSSISRYKRLSKWYCGFIHKLPMWVLKVWDAFQNFFYRNFRLILSRSHLKRLVQEMHFMHPKNRWIHHLERRFLSYACAAVQMNIPMEIAY